MSTPAIAVPVILKLQSSLGACVPGLRRYLRLELARRGINEPVRNFSHICEAAHSVAADPVDAQIPTIARAVRRRNKPGFILELDTAGLATLARAIATYSVGLPLTVLVASEHDRHDLAHFRPVIPLPEAVSAEWTAALASLRIRPIVHASTPPVFDLSIESWIAASRLRLVAGNTLEVGFDDDDSSLDTNLAPLPTKNLHDLQALAIKKHWSNPIAEIHAPAQAWISQLGNSDGDTAYTAFASAFRLKAERPVETFLAQLPHELRNCLDALLTPRDAAIGRKTPIDTLWRSLLMFADLNARGLADLQQALAIIPLARALFGAMAVSRRLPKSHHAEILFGRSLRHENALPHATSLLRDAVIARRPLQPAISAVIDELRVAWPAKPLNPLRPATIRSLIEIDRLPEPDVLNLLNAYHHAFPKAPRLSYSEAVHVASCLSTVVPSHPIHSDNLCAIHKSLIPVFRPSQFGLSYQETQDCKDLLSWIADCIDTLIPSHEINMRLECRAAAISILLPPHATAATIRSRIAHWHSRIDDLETETFDFEIGCEAFGKHIRHSAPFPHFLRGPATVLFSGVEATVTPLTSHAAILEEGRAMRHCVGGFRNAAACGYSLIVAIATEDARSTAEYRATVDGYELIQHAGPNNTKPTPHHVEIAGSLARIALKAPYARDQLPLLLGLSQLGTLEPHDFMTPAELEAYRALKFRQLGARLTPLERKLSHVEWTDQLLPLHCRRFTHDSDPIMRQFLLPMSSELPSARHL